MKNLFFKIIWNVIKLIFILCITALIFGYPTMLLWNYTLPELFGLGEITFIQASCLNLLSSLLIKSSILNPVEKEVINNTKEPIRKFNRR